LGVSLPMLIVAWRRPFSVESAICGFPNSIF
jgi:hypothetical protein